MVSKVIGDHIWYFCRKQIRNEQQEPSNQQPMWSHVTAIVKINNFHSALVHRRWSSYQRMLWLEVHNNLFVVDRDSSASDWNSMNLHTMQWSMGLCMCVQGSFHECIEHKPFSWRVHTAHIWTRVNNNTAYDVMRLSNAHIHNSNWFDHVFHWLRSMEFSQLTDVLRVNGFRRMRAIRATHRHIVIDTSKVNTLCWSRCFTFVFSFSLFLSLCTSNGNTYVCACACGSLGLCAR